MKAFLIDPVARTIEEVEHDGSLDSIYRLIGADCFACASFDADGNGAYVDDEGLLKPNQEFFLIDGYPQPLAGKGLVLGCDELGETIEPTLSLEDLRNKTRFLNSVQVRAWTAQFQ